MGRPHKYPVTLSDAERAELQALVRTGHASARVHRRAQMLLWSDAGRQDKDIAALLDCDTATVAATRQRWMTDKRLTDLPRPGGTPKLDDLQTAHLVALACSDAPEGRAVWTMQLLADTLVELRVVERLSDETVRRTLKKNALKPWQEHQWCLAQVDAAFVWRMEAVLDVYAAPYDPQQPVVCFDERPCQLVADTVAPLPPQAGRAKRVDYEYERRGVCNAFLMVQPLVGWRHVKVTDRRTKQDFAAVMQELVDVHFPQADVIHVVLDNLNTHTPAALYDTFG